MYKITFFFSKKGLMRYISHLDLMRLFMRSMRRSGLPLKMTEGFSPHPKFSIKRALKLGLESENEEASVVLREEVKPEEFRQRLQQQLPEGIIIKEAFEDRISNIKNQISKTQTKILKHFWILICVFDFCILIF